MAARYVPGSGNVGGDWYDVFSLPSGHVCAVIGDVTGTGLHAAVIMGRMRSALRAYALESDDPGEVLERLSRKMRHFEPDAMASVLCAMISPSLDQVRVSSAGHLPPLIAYPGRPAGPAEVPPERAHRHGQPGSPAGLHHGPAARSAAVPVHRWAGGTP